MKDKKNIYTIVAISAIVLLFIVSVIWPVTQFAAKLAALVIFSYISFFQLSQRKKEGENIERSMLFTIAVIVILAYVFFF